MPATGHAHAKAILLGEHAVVYGSPALALPLHALPVTATVAPTARACLTTSLFAGPEDDAPDELAPLLAAIAATGHALGQRSPLDVHVTSAIPPACGLGSSAAVAAAVVDAIDHLTGPSLDADVRFDLIQTAERVAHGNPSGLDARTVVAEAPVRFHHGAVMPVTVSGAWAFVVADTGRPGRTREAVSEVAARRANAPAVVDAAIARVAALVDAAADALAAPDRPRLGAALDEAHALLAGLGVSSVELDDLTVAARAAGALGAKLTGGGRGGCLLALAPSADDALRIAAVLTDAGAARTWITTIGDPQ